MKTRALTSVLVVLLFSAFTAFSGTGAQAAGNNNGTTKATAGGLCAKAASTTVISGKSYTCTKVLSGKTVWIATTTTGAKPQISGPAHGDGGAGEDGGGLNPGATNNDLGRKNALKAYNSCLTSHGGTAVTSQAFHPQGGEDDGMVQVTPSAKPVSPAQQKALAACAALAPKPHAPGAPGADN